MHAHIHAHARTHSTPPHPTHTPHTHSYSHTTCIRTRTSTSHHPCLPSLTPPTPTWPLQLYDRVRAYYSLLSLQPEEVLRAAAERPMKYGYADWMALLQVPG